MYFAASRERIIIQDDTGTVCDDRVCHRREGAEGDNMEIEGQEGGNLENDLVAAEDLGELMDITPSQVTLRATKMFTEGDGAPCTSQEPAITTSATPWLINLAKEAVWQLFDLHQRRRIWALRRLSNPPAKPPCRFIDRQGSWFEPTWRDGGVETSTPS